MPDKSSLKPLWADSVSKMVPERGLEIPAKPQLKSSMVLCLKHSFSPGWGKKGAAGQPRLTLLHPSLFQPTNHSASQTMRSKLFASCFGSESQNTIKFWQSVLVMMKSFSTGNKNSSDSVLVASCESMIPSCSLGALVLRKRSPLLHPWSPISVFKKK